MDSHFIEIYSRRLHYVTSGVGPPLVFLHGHRAGVFRCKILIEKLARKYKVYAPDLPGFGQSEPLPGWHHLPKYLPYLSEFIKKLGLTNFTLGGISMGTSLAVLLAQKFPRKVKKLILIVPILDRTDLKISRPKHLFSLFTLAIFPRTKPLVYLTDKVIASDRIFKRFLKLTFPKSERSPEILAYEAKQWRVMPIKIWAQTLFSLLTLRCHDPQKLPIPTIAVYTENDQCINLVKAKKRLQELFPQTKIFSIPHLKHVPRGEISASFLSQFTPIFSQI